MILDPVNGTHFPLKNRRPSEPATTKHPDVQLLKSFEDRLALAKSGPADSGGGGAEQLGAVVAFLLLGTRCIATSSKKLLVAFLFLIVMPEAPSSVRSLLVAMPFAPSSFLLLCLVRRKLENVDGRWQKLLVSGKVSFHCWSMSFSQFETKQKWGGWGRPSC